MAWRSSNRKNKISTLPDPLPMQRSGLADGEKRSAKQKLDVLQAKVDDLQERRDALQGRVDTLQADKAALQADKADLQAKLDKAKGKP